MKAPTIINHEAEITEKPISSLSKTPTTEQLKDYLGQMINKYGGNYALIDDVITCESGWRTNVFSWNGSSYGVAQFTPDTFKENCDGEYENPYNQIECMVVMFGKGMSSRWDCFKILN